MDTIIPRSPAQTPSTPASAVDALKASLGTTPIPGSASKAVLNAFADKENGPPNLIAFQSPAAKFAGTKRLSSTRLSDVNTPSTPGGTKTYPRGILSATPVRGAGDENAAPDNNTDDGAPRRKSARLSGASVSLESHPIEAVAEPQEEEIVAPPAEQAPASIPEEEPVRVALGELPGANAAANTASQEDVTGGFTGVLMADSLASPTIDGGKKANRKSSARRVSFAPTPTVRTFIKDSDRSSTSPMANAFVDEVEDGKLNDVHDTSEEDEDEESEDEITFSLRTPDAASKARPSIAALGDDTMNITGDLGQALGDADDDDEDELVEGRGSSTGMDLTAAIGGLITMPQASPAPEQSPAQLSPPEDETQNGADEDIEVTASGPTGDVGQVPATPSGMELTGLTGLSVADAETTAPEVTIGATTMNIGGLTAAVGSANTADMDLTSVSGGGAIITAPSPAPSVGLKDVDESTATSMNRSADGATTAMEFTSAVGSIVEAQSIPGPAQEPAEPAEQPGFAKKAYLRKSTASSIPVTSDHVSKKRPTKSMPASTFASPPASVDSWAVNLERAMSADKQAAEKFQQEAETDFNPFATASKMARTPPAPEQGRSSTSSRRRGSSIAPSDVLPADANPFASRNAIPRTPQRASISEAPAPSISPMAAPDFGSEESVPKEPTPPQSEPEQPVSEVRQQQRLAPMEVVAPAASVAPTTPIPTPAVQHTPIQAPASADLPAIPPAMTPVRPAAPVAPSAVSLDEFLSTALMTLGIPARNRQTSLGLGLMNQASEFGDGETALANLPLTSQLKAAAKIKPEVDSYKWGVDALKAHMDKLNQDIAAKEAAIAEHNPAVFAQLKALASGGAASEEEYKELRGKLGALKDKAKHQARAKWYKWHKDLEARIVTELHGSKAALEADQAVLKTQAESLSESSNALCQALASIDTKEVGQSLALDASVIDAMVSMGDDAISVAESDLQSMQQVMDDQTMLISGLNDEVREVKAQIEEFKAQQAQYLQEKTTITANLEEIRSGNHGGLAAATEVARQSCKLGPVVPAALDFDFVKQLTSWRPVDISEDNVRVLVNGTFYLEFVLGDHRGVEHGARALKAVNMTVAPDAVLATGMKQLIGSSKMLELMGQALYAIQIPFIMEEVTLRLGRIYDVLEEVKSLKQARGLVEDRVTSDGQYELALTWSDPQAHTRFTVELPISPTYPFCHFSESRVTVDISGGRKNLSQDIHGVLDNVEPGFGALARLTNRIDSFVNALR